MVSGPSKPVVTKAVKLFSGRRLFHDVVLRISTYVSLSAVCSSASINESIRVVPAVRDDDAHARSYEC